MTITKKSFEGFLQLLTRNVISRIMGLISLAILARELTPYDFGLVSITQVLLSIIACLATGGIAEFLLAYKGKDWVEIFKSAFWFNLAISIIVAVAAFIILPYWSDFHNDTRIYNIGLMTIGVFMFGQNEMMAKTFLNKTLNFKKLVKVSSIFIILNPLLKISFALLGFGVYSLILPSLLLAPFQSLAFFWVSDFRPGLQLMINRWAEIFRFSKNILASTFISAVMDHADKLILANFMSLDALGVYNIAWRTANILIDNVITITNQILSSVLPRISHNLELLKEKYFIFLKFVLIGLGPLFVVAIVAAPELIGLVYGRKWEEAIIPFQVLNGYALFRSLTSSYGCIMNTMQLPHKALIVNAIYAPVHLIGAFIGIQFGVVGLAISVVLVKIVFIQWGIHQTMNAIGKRFYLFYEELGKMLMLLIIITLAMLPISEVIRANSNYSVIVIVVSGLLTIFSFHLIARILKPKMYSELLREIGKLSPKVSATISKLIKI